MLIRASGYNTGAQEYLEQGNKSGREFTRDELDYRLILDGQLSVTREIYESIPDYGQDRYLTFTMSFKEDHVDPEVLKAITAEFKSFLMHAYVPGEFNFYAEAHIPKIKEIQDKKTGELIERKPHIHIIVPRINLLSGNEANPVDVYMKHEKYFEAFQEYINQNYGLASPRENVRADIEDAASVLSRYKADDFYGKNRQFKQALVTDVIERGINSRADFYAMVAEHGETRIRNEGKDNEYLAVKLPGDAKFTNLKETIFQDEFIVGRSLKKPPLDPAVIYARLQEWPQRSKEIKYINKMASPALRERYWNASPGERASLLAEREQKFYRTYGGHHVDKFVSSPRDRQRGPAEAQHPGHHAAADGLPDVSLSDVAGHGQAEPARQVDGAVLLQGHAHVHLGQRDEGGDPGLRSAVPGGRGGRGGTSLEGRGLEQPAALPATTARARAAGARRGSARSAGRTRPGRRGGPVGSNELPPDARNPHRVRSMDDIEQRGRRLFGSAADPAGYSHLEHAGVSAGQPATRKKRRRARADSRPPDARNPHRVRSIADIERRGRQLFGAGGDQHAPANRPDPGAVGQRTARKKKRRTDKVDARPPHAWNPHRVGSMADIKARTRRLFASTGSEDPARLVKRPTFKQLLINRSASTVAAYFTRQAEHNQLMPAQRRALRRINKQYFDLRRSVFSDPRLTRQDKTQLVSVLAFERLKAREAIQNPQHNTEDVLMGSAEIRNLIQGVEEETPAPAFSFTAPRGMHKRPEGVRDQVKRVLDSVSRRLDRAPTERDEERERELNAKDLYTRKATFTKNVHYLDKKTNKTLFVDTGKAIVMRRTGISESGVAVALELAKERFGSTLSINGTAEFKQLVVEAAAKNGIDVHFTDKVMNQALADRRAELEIEREGQGIAQPSVVDIKVMQASAAAANAALAEQAKRASANDAETPAQDLVAVDAQWLQSQGMEGDKAITDAQMNERGVLHATWLFNAAERSAESMALIEKLMSNPAYKAGFERAVNSPEARATNASVGSAERAERSELVNMDRVWRQNLGMSEEEILASPTAMAIRGESHANWLYGTEDHTTQSVAMLTKYMEDDAYRESFKRAIDDLYAMPMLSGDRAVLERAVGFVFDLVNDIEHRDQGKAAAPASKAVDRKAIEGVLLEHGSAPYLHDPKNAGKPPSYFVTLQLDSGAERTLWGVGLQDVMRGDPEPFYMGDRVRITDLGTEPVKITEKQEDGQVIEKITKRREWAGEILEMGPAHTAHSAIDVDAEARAPEKPIETDNVLARVRSDVDHLAHKAVGGGEAFAHQAAMTHLAIFANHVDNTRIAAAIAQGVGTNERYAQTIKEHAPAEWKSRFAEQVPASRLDSTPSQEEVGMPEGPSVNVEDLGTDPRSVADYAPDDSYVDVHIQVEEDEPRMD